MKTYKLTLSILLTILLSLGLFSGCNAVENDSKQYNYYEFSTQRAEVVKIPAKYLDLNIVEKDVKSVENNKILSDEYVDNSGKKLFVDNEFEYYYDDYYIVSKDYEGLLPKGSDGKFIEGFGEIVGKEVWFSGDGIIMEKGEVVGNYSVYNNYVEISFDGVTKVCLMFDISTNEEKQLALYSQFYCSTAVVTKPVVNAGFEINTKYIAPTYNGHISIKYLTRGYEPTNVEFKVVDNGGYSFVINSLGEYYLRDYNKLPKKPIIISVEVDNNFKLVELLPISFDFIETYHELEVGEVFNVDDVNNIYMTNCDYSDIKLEINDDLGTALAVKDDKNTNKDEEPEVIDIMTLDNGKLTFNVDGNFTIPVKATITVEDVEYDFNCSMNFNVTNPIEDEKDAK